MVIEINKDIDRYQESVLLGLTARQLIYSAASVIVGGGLVLLLYKYIGLTGAAYVAIPCVAPIAMGGFYSYNGMNFYEYMGRRIHFMFGNKPLTYISTESESEAKKLGNQDTAVKKKGLFGSALPGAKKSKRDEDFEKKFGNEELSPEAQALADKVKKEDFEAMKKKMKTMVIAVVIGVIAMIAAIIVKKFVL